MRMSVRAARRLLAVGALGLVSLTLAACGYPSSDEGHDATPIYYELGGIHQATSTASEEAQKVALSRKRI